MAIPEPQAAAPADDGISDLLDDVGMRAGVARCPGCGAELSEDAVLCVMCGFDSRRGHRLKARVGSAADLDDDDLGDLPVHGVAELDYAERQLALDKKQQKSLSTGMPWWMLLIALLALVGFVVGMLAMPQDQVMRNSGISLIVGGTLLSFYFSVRILIAAFSESALTGILYLFVPFYALYFVVSRWDRVGGLFLFSMLGGVMSTVGYLMMFHLAGLFEAGNEDEYATRLLPQRPVMSKYISDVTRV